MAKKILSVSAKCSDLCSIEYVDENGKIIEHDGYVPENIGVGGGDYIDFEIDVETGQILNWNTTEEQIIKALSK